MKREKAVVVADEYAHMEADILGVLGSFDEFGSILQQERNTIRRGQLNGLDITVKSYRKPNWFQGLVYRFLRPSKAKRSFLYATVLGNKGIGTAKPIAYIECYQGLGLTASYFVSEYVEHDFTIREVLRKEVDDKDSIIESFVAFTLKLHENEVVHLDHSPGNTLIKRDNGDYVFSIIDINRMKFSALNLSERLNNFVRLTNDKEDLERFASIYAKLTGSSLSMCLDKMRVLSAKRIQKVERKRRLKRLLKKN